MYEYLFWVFVYYVLIICFLVILEGIVINVEFNFKVLSKVYFYVVKCLLIDFFFELRIFLRDLFFKDGDFCWNRLENLLRNVSNSDDYNISKVLD